MPEIVLHAGLHKTGTTSVQTTFFLAPNNRRLETLGVIYPRSLQANHSHFLYTAFADEPDRLRRNVRDGYTPPGIDVTRATVLASIENELRSRRGHHVVISAEELSSLTAPNLASLKQFLESLFEETPCFRVAIYVRSPISWIASVIQEKIKAGLTYDTAYGEMEQMAARLYRSRIEKFFKVFGETFVHIHQFERATRHELGIVGHFLSWMGVKRHRIESLRLVRANESVSQFAADLVSFVNEQLPSREGKPASLEELKPLLALTGPKFDLPHRHKQALMSLVSDDVRWLRQVTGIDYEETTFAKDATSAITPELLADARAAKAMLPSNVAALVDEYIALRFSRD